MSIPKILPFCLIPALLLAMPATLAVADEDELEAFSEPSAPKKRTAVKQYRDRTHNSALDISMSADESPIPSSKLGSSEEPSTNLGKSPAQIPLHAPNKSFQKAFSDSLAADGIRFTQKERIITILYKLKNCTVRIGVIFDKENGAYAKVYAFPFDKPAAAKRAGVLDLCNTLNAQYKWCKFYVSERGSINLDIDVRLPKNSPSEAVQLCRDSIRSMNTIIDAAYPRFIELLGPQKNVK